MHREALLLGAAALGAGCAYVLDPDSGRRRRALVRDKVTKLYHEGADAAGVAKRDLEHRMARVRAGAQGLLRREPVTDDVLLERVRSKLGRVVSHPRAIDVAVTQGTVILSGPLLADEVQPLLRSVERVRGVTDVVNSLEPHVDAASVPALQGHSRRSGDRFELMQQNWSPTARLLTGLAGGILALYAVRRRGLLGTVSCLIGTGLLGRAVTNRELKSLLGLPGSRDTASAGGEVVTREALERDSWPGHEPLSSS